MTNTIRMILASLLLCAAGAGAADRTAVKMENFVCDGGFFTAQVPAGWPKNEAISLRRQAREYGVDLKGPAGKDGVFTRISLTFFGPDHARFKTVEKYLNINSRPDPDFPVPGEKYGPLSVVLVAHRRAQQFELKTFTFVPPDGENPLKVAVYERHVVLPGKKGGFYVLTYHAPADIAKANLPVFEAVLAGFKPAK